MNIENLNFAKKKKQKIKDSSFKSPIFDDPTFLYFNNIRLERRNALKFQLVCKVHNIHEKKLTALILLLGDILCHYLSLLEPKERLQPIAISNEIN